MPCSTAMEGIHNKTILVYDIRWNGHAPTYHKLICEELLQQGWNVVSASPMPHDVAAHFEGKDTMGRLVIKDDNLDAPQPAHNNAGAAPMAPTAGKAVSLKLKILNAISRIKYIDNYFQVIERWKRLDSLIKTKMQGITPIVFIPYLGEKWLHPLLSAQFIEKRFNYKWTGIYITIELNRKSLMVNRLKPLHQFNIFKANNCLGLYILEENVLGTIKAMAHNNVWMFPDITNIETDSTYTDPVLQAVAVKAQGKKVILLAGIVNERKNIYGFLQAAEIARQKGLPWLFVIGGYTNPYFWNNKENYERFVQLLKQNEGNVVAKTDGLADGKAFNAYVLKADVIFAAYTNFYNSSNILTKAAHFQKPVIVSTGYLMDYRQRKYRLGKSVSQSSPVQIVEAIQELLNPVPAEKPLYEEYYNLHTPQQIKLALKNLQ